MFHRPRIVPTGRKYIVPTIFGALLLGGCGGGGSGDRASMPTRMEDPPSQPDPPPGLATEPAFTRLSFQRPVALIQAPGDSERWFVIEQDGLVRIFDDDAAVATSSVFVDIRDRVDSGPGEAGLLGLAFHPDFGTNGQVLLSYTQPGLLSVVSRFRSLDGGQTLDPAGEEILLTVVQDFSNHNGGHLAFADDGLLYIGFGDGGSADDPNDRAQDTTNLLGTIVRLDVDGATPYAIPADNPFAGNPDCLQGFGSDDCPEIFAWGLRNPWRWHFDQQTGQLWAGDVGQGAWEEINIVTAGGNYGWRIREGAHCNIPSSGCSTAGLTDPVAEYPHSVGRSVTGGFVYRGQQIPGLFGWYVFGDFTNGRIFGVDTAGPFPATPEILAETGLSIVSFAQSSTGELFLLDYGTGGIHRILASQ